MRTLLRRLGVLGPAAGNARAQAKAEARLAVAVAYVTLCSPPSATPQALRVHGLWFQWAMHLDDALDGMAQAERAELLDGILELLDAAGSSGSPHVSPRIQYSHPSNLQTSLQRLAHPFISASLPWRSPSFHKRGRMLTHPQWAY